MKVRTSMSTLKGSRAPIERKANSSVVEIMVQNEEEKREGEHIVPKRAATKRWNNARKMEVDEGLQLRNKYG